MRESRPSSGARGVSNRWTETDRTATKGLQPVPRFASTDSSTTRPADSGPSGPRGDTRAAGRRTLAAVVALCALAAAALVQAPAGSAASCGAGKCAQTFNSTGSPQEWKVPAGVSSATFAVAGAGGGGGFWFSTGGDGALVTTTFTLVEGEQLKLVVGSPGGHHNSETYGGGGSGVEDSAYGPAGGGGSFIFSPAGSLLVASGGGGGGGSENNGGNGGQTGSSGGSFMAPAGGGASQSGGGTGAPSAESGQGPTTTTAIEGHGGKGSTAAAEGGGGGGGGLYGGGGGGSSGIWSGGAGGGSSIVNGGSSTTIESGAGGAGGETRATGTGGHITVSFTQPTTSVTELASTEEASVGETVTYTATVSPVPTNGTVSFEDEGSAIPGCWAAPVSATTGEADCEAEPEEAGIDVVTARYSGSSDQIYAAATSNTREVTVRTATTTQLKDSTSTPTVGETVTYTATVAPVPTGGTIAFEDAGKPVSGCEAQTVNAGTGKAVCEQTYDSPGTHSVTAAYSGSTDTLYRPSSSATARVTVSKPATTPTPETSTGPVATPTPPTVHPATSDKPAVVLTKAPQGLINTRSLRIVFRCGSSACSAIAKLTVTLAGSHWTLTSTQGSASADQRSTITLKVPARLRRAVRRYLVHHRHAMPAAVLAVTLTDARSTPETTNISLGVWTLPGFR